jgi:putative transposase
MVAELMDPNMCGPPTGEQESNRRVDGESLPILPGSGRHRHTPGEIVEKLRTADMLLADGTPISSVVAELNVSEATFHRWRAHYGGIKADDARRLRELEQENRDLKSVVANQCLDILMLRQLTRGKF